MLGQEISSACVRSWRARRQQAGLLQPTQNRPTWSDSDPGTPADVFAHQLNLFIRPPSRARCQTASGGTTASLERTRHRFRRWSPDPAAWGWGSPLCVYGFNVLVWVGLGGSLRESELAGSRFCRVRQKNGCSGLSPVWQRGKLVAVGAIGSAAARPRI